MLTDASDACICPCNQVCVACSHQCSTTIIHGKLIEDLSLIASDDSEQKEKEIEDMSHIESAVLDERKSRLGT